MSTTRQLKIRARAASRTRPACEPLEGRALMAYSAYDPTFGSGGVVVGAPDTGTGTELSGGYAVAVGADGKVVEVGVYGTNPRIIPPTGQLAVRRFNADGSVDTGFGAGGQATIPLPANASGVQGGPRDVVVQADGSILVAATLRLQSEDPTARQTEGVVAKLTADGTLDAGFGTGGQYILAGTTISASAVAVDTNGNVLVLGGDNDPSGVPPGGTQSPAANRLVLTRLTPAGALDTSFNTTGRLAIELPADQLTAGPSNPAFATLYEYAAAALAIAPGGQIYVAGNDVVTGPSGQNTQFANVSRVNTTGTLDTTFGAGGTATVGADLRAVGRFATINDMAFDADGKLVVVGSASQFFLVDGFINRLLPDGTLDATFAANSTTAAPGPQLGGAGYSYDAVAIGADGSVNIAGFSLYGAAAVVRRFTNAGAIDSNFGRQGIAPVSPYVPADGRTVTSHSTRLRGLALTAEGDLVVAGQYVTQYVTQPGSSDLGNDQSNLLVKILPVAVTPLAGDYDGDGRADVAAYLPGQAVYAFRPSGGLGGGDALATFGAAGAGASIPAPGDYDGDGRADLAVYIPAQAKFYYRSSINGTDRNFAFGNASSIPAPGDYDGDGRTDLAVYEPAIGSFVVLDSSTGISRSISFGAPGIGASIPAPGDYDGDGKADLAVYLPAYGVLAYRPSSGAAGTPDVLTSFGAAGDRASIPAPGDYDGDGKADLAVYIPQYAVYAYRPSSGGPDVLTSFGVTGDGGSIPSPGDYDGDGRYDLAVYIPQYALFAYRPSGAVAASSDALTNFGTVGAGATVPASSIPYAQAPTVSGQSLASSGGVEVPLSLFDEALETLTGVKKKRA